MVFEKQIGISYQFLKLRSSLFYYVVYKCTQFARVSCLCWYIFRKKNKNKIDEYLWFWPMKRHSCFPCIDFEVRLVNGNFPGDGYVQTRCSESNWKTICTSSWDLREANVVCKQLGFPYAYGTQPSGNLASGLGEVAVYNPFCRGDEQQLRDCLFAMNFDCREKPAGVQCAESKYGDKHLMKNYMGYSPITWFLLIVLFLSFICFFFPLLSLLLCLFAPSY